MKNWIYTNIGLVTFIIPGIGLIAGFCIAVLIQSLFGEYLPWFPETMGEFFLRPLHLGFAVISILSTALMLWSVYVKRRKWPFYLFFVPLPLMAVTVLVLNIMSTHGVLFSDHYMQHGLWHLISTLEGVAFGCWILWHVGWLTVLFWKCKKRECNGSIDFSLRKPRLLRISVRSVPTLKSLLYTTGITVFLTLVVWGIVAGNSYEGVCFGYTQESRLVATGEGTVQVSYEYPSCFSASDDEMENSVFFERYSRVKWTGFRPSYGSEVSLECSPTDTDPASENLTLVEKSVNHSQLYFLVSKVEIVSTKTGEVDGYQADTVELLCDLYGGYWISDQYLIRYTEFEAGNMTWKIYMDGVFPDTRQHEQFYEHLLKTFILEVVQAHD